MKGRSILAVAAIVTVAVLGASPGVARAEEPQAAALPPGQGWASKNVGDPAIVYLPFTKDSRIDPKEAFGYFKNGLPANGDAGRVVSEDARGATFLGIDRTLLGKDVLEPLPDEPLTYRLKGAVPANAVMGLYKQSYGSGGPTMIQNPRWTNEAALRVEAARSGKPVEGGGPANLVIGQDRKGKFPSLAFGNAMPTRPGVLNVVVYTQLSNVYGEGVDKFYDQGKQWPEMNALALARRVLDHLEKNDPQHKVSVINLVASRAAGEYAGGWSAAQAFTDALRSLGVKEYRRPEGFRGFEVIASHANLGRIPGAVLTKVPLGETAIVTDGVFTGDIPTGKLDMERPDRDRKMITYNGTVSTYLGDKSYARLFHAHGWVPKTIIGPDGKRQWLKGEGHEQDHFTGEQYPSGQAYQTAMTGGGGRKVSTYLSGYTAKDGQAADTARREAAAARSAARAAPPTSPSPRR